MHQPANKRDISTALYPIGNAAWQQFPLEICHSLPYSHSCSHLKGHVALMECAGSCSHTSQQHRGWGASRKSPAHTAGCFTTNSSCFAFFPQLFFTYLAIHWVQNTFLPFLPSPSISPLWRGSAWGQMPPAALGTGQNHDLSSWDKGTGQSHDLSSWDKGTGQSHDLSSWDKAAQPH